MLPLQITLDEACFQTFVDSKFYNYFKIIKKEKLDDMNIFCNYGGCSLENNEFVQELFSIPPSTLEVEMYKHLAAQHEIYLRATSCSFKDPPSNKWKECPTENQQIQDLKIMTMNIQKKGASNASIAGLYGV